MGRITVKNVIRPGSERSVDGAMYGAMKRAILAALPRADPGLTLAELHEAIAPHLSVKLYPGGARAGWWLKTVQLDLEARKVISRSKTSPIRLRRGR
jgi:hypothetical protein